MKTEDEKLLSSLRKKYPEAKHAPKPNCQYCNGTGKRYIAKKSELTGNPIGNTCCICIFMNHDDSDDVAKMLGEFARKKLREISR